MVAYVLFIIALALLFDFANGLNDAANSIATIVSTRVLSPRKAVLWAAFFNFVAAFGFEMHVASTIGTGLVLPNVISPHMVLATLLAAIVWTVFCTHLGLPISVSHALIGAMAGAALVVGGAGALMWSKIAVIAAFIVLSPLIGLAFGMVNVVVTTWLVREQSPRVVDSVFRILQLVSAAIYSLGHGLNDAQKTMGIIYALLLSVPELAPWATHDGDPNSDRLAWWIILSCQAAIALGTYLGGWRVVHTLGHRVTKLRPIDGFCAESGGGVTILALSQVGIPVSTTHTITGAIFGVGSMRRMRGVRWSVGSEIVLAWVLTLPAAGLLAAGLYFSMTLLFGLVRGPA